MGPLRFFPEEYCVEHAGEKIKFLPKEYALFAFLFNHRNQGFSREELLNRVWGLEEPTDRTVDDHIYRLRKKLLPWSHFTGIETIRGYGYRLAMKESTAPNLPSHIPAFSESVKQMFETYHGLGMGQAMQMLTANQNILGIELDPFYSVYIHFVTGDFAWILEQRDVSPWDRIIYLLFIYQMIRPDSPDTLAFFERALAKKERLPGNWGTELEINLISLYLENGLIEQCRARLPIAEEAVAAINSPSFTLVLLSQKIRLALATEEQSLAKKWLDQAGDILGHHPQQRELGIYRVLHGLWLFREGQRQEARKMVDQGIETLQQTKFVPHLLQGVLHLLRQLQNWKCDPDWQRKYEKLWQQLAKQYRLAELEGKIYHRLNTLL